MHLVRDPPRLENEAKEACLGRYISECLKRLGGKNPRTREWNTAVEIGNLLDFSPIFVIVKLPQQYSVY